MLIVSTHMSGLETWAREEFGAADLGDPRRSSRVIRVVAEMAELPGGRVASVIKGAARQEAAFRLLRNSAVDTDELASSSHKATLGRLGERVDFWSQLIRRQLQ